MARVGGLVDLSLFATPPVNGRDFATASYPPGEGRHDEVSCYYEQRDRNHAVHDSPAMKPLPPLPPRRLCRRVPATRRSDPTSRCILTRIRRTKMDTEAAKQGPTLQQRRNAATTPQLTLSLPPVRREEQFERRSRPAMIWLPEEQMWLIQDEIPVNPDANLRSDPLHRYRAPHGYTRSEPSPEPSRFDLPLPRSPFHQEPLEFVDSPDEIRDQFLRLIGPPDNDRLSPLFQEAIQSVPPMTDPSPTTARPSQETQREWKSEASEHESYHTAHSTFYGAPTILSTPIIQAHQWRSHRNDGSTEDPSSGVSQMSDRAPWNQPFRISPGEDLRNDVSDFSCGSSWALMAGQLARPASAMT